jgi:hypothetical protein
MAIIVRELALRASIWQVFFDDSARNIAAGKAAGFHTVIVSSFAVTTFASSIFFC